jgi:ADP-ribose pyrophosphatase YjhB (NUDIX family)
MAHPTLFVALKAFIERDGKILVLREAGSYVDGTRIGKYDVPGGRLNPGENFAEGLKREVKEETGLDVAFGDAFHMGEWRPSVRGEEWHIVATFVRCRSESGDVVLGTDHDAYEWIDPILHRSFDVSEPIHNAFESYLKGKF